MTTTMVAEPAESASFSVEELYELQKRRGKTKPPTVAYSQRNALKAKMRRSDNIFNVSLRSIAGLVSATWRIVTYGPWRWTFDISSWRLRNKCNPKSKYDDVTSGRSRFERMSRPAAATWGPLDRNVVYDPYQGAMTRMGTERRAD